MYTRAPSEVIHGRSFPAKSMICAVQLLMSKLDEVAPWHVIAATEICAERKGLLTGITNVVACSVPVERKSTSASPPPNTTAYPALVRALSIGPCRFGVEPKSPVQSCVPKGNNQPNDVIAMKCPLNAISGSLPCRWRWKKGPKQRWSGYFSLCPFPSWKGVFSQNGPQRSRARRCCAAKRTLHGEDRSEILDKRERGGPKWTAKMAQSLTASDTRLRSKATASATPKSYACNRRSTLSKQTPGSAYSRLIRTSKIAYRP